MSPEKSSLEILLIEDDPAVTHLLLTALLKADMTITAVHTLAQGTVKVAEKRYDLIILDLSLPDSVGLETARMMLTLCPQIPIVVFTGLMPCEDSVLLLKEGVKDYIVKGETDIKTIIERVRAAVASGKAAKDAIKSLAPLTKAIDQLVKITKE